MSTKESTLAVDGMTCSSCVRHVEKALRGLSGITGVKVDLQKGIAAVEYEADGAPSIEAMIAALTDAGYESRVI